MSQRPCSEVDHSDVVDANAPAAEEERLARDPWIIQAGGVGQAPQIAVDGQVRDLETIDYRVESAYDAVASVIACAKSCRIRELQDCRKHSRANDPLATLWRPTDIWNALTRSPLGQECPWPEVNGLVLVYECHLLIKQICRAPVEWVVRGSASLHSIRSKGKKHVTLNHGRRIRHLLFQKRIEEAHSARCLC